MHLEGSCHCGAVRFSLEAPSPVPYMRCYCSICRKTAGAGGFAINLGGLADTLKVEGEEHITMFHAIKDGKPGHAERRFCSKCGSALWAWDPRWPELIHPFAGAIDTPLPEVPAHTHIMQDSKPAWVRLDVGEGDECFAEYPDRSLEQWHRDRGLLGGLSSGEGSGD